MLWGFKKNIHILMHQIFIKQFIYLSINYPYASIDKPLYLSGVTQQESEESEVHWSGSGSSSIQWRRDPGFIPPGMLPIPTYLLAKVAATGEERDGEGNCLFYASGQTWPITSYSHVPVCQNLVICFQVHSKEGWWVFVHFSPGRGSDVKNK